MKNTLGRILLLTMVSLAAVAAVCGQDIVGDDAMAMKGTDKPKFVVPGNSGTCLVFPFHVVKTTSRDDGGDNIDLWILGTAARSAAACNTKIKPDFTVDDVDSSSFYGLTEKYFFIDSGTSTESRTLVIYDIDTTYEISRIDYSGEPTLSLDRYLTYDEPSDKKGPIATCKEAAKWKRDGGSVGWVQGKKLDLTTQRSTNVGALRCVYLQ